MRVSLALTTAMVALGLLPASSAHGQVSSSPWFISVKVTAAGATITPVAAADFDGDGKPDLLASGSFTTLTGGHTSLAVLFGNGDGSFKAVPITNFMPSNPAQTIYQVADVNGDRIPDLIASDPGPQSCPANNPGCGIYKSGSITVALGNPNRTFQNPQTYTGHGKFIPSSFVVADVNGDDRPDLVVLTAPQSPSSVTSGEVQVLLNEGNGKFRQGSTFASSITRLYGTGDFTNDGRQDIAGVGPDNVQILKNLGNGSLQLAATYAVPSVTSLGVADLDRDGHADLIIAGNYAPLVLLGNGDYTFRTTAEDGSNALTFPLGGQTNSNPVLFGDFNQDSHLDFVVHQYTYFGHGDGTFTLSKVYSPGPDFAQLLADINQDGLPDLIGNADNSLIVSFGGKYGILNAPLEMVTAPNTQNIATADLNRDGILDLAVFAAASSGNGQQQEMNLYPGTGKGYFNPAKTFLIPTGQALVGDVNNDGYQDIVVVADPNITVLLGGPGLTFAPPQTYNLPTPVPPGSNPGAIATLVDVNHDGKLDIVGLFGVLLGNGDGTFQPVLPLDGDKLKNVGLWQFALGDLDGDGNLDMVLLSTDHDQDLQDLPEAPINLFAIRGNGDGTFFRVGPPENVQHVGTCKSCNGIPGLQTFSYGGLSVIDVNQDGLADIVYTVTGMSDEFTQDVLVVELSDGKGGFGKPMEQPLGTRAMYGARTVPRLS
jgi:FG-GAP-like repeat